MLISDESLGGLVDLDQTEFEQRVVSDCNLGSVNNLTLVLENTYHLLRSQKDSIIDLVTSGKRKKDDPEVNTALSGLYAEMTKIELKVTFLKTRAKELSKAWKTPVDTSV